MENRVDDRVVGGVTQSDYLPVDLVVGQLSVVFAQVEDLLVGDRDIDTFESYPYRLIAEDLDKYLVPFIYFGSVRGQGIGQVGVRFN